MILTNPAFPNVTEAWFDPDYWGAQARPVDAGGRGSAWFVDAGEHGLVLRQYRRGGFVAKISEKQYLFTGYKRVRSIAEFELLKELYDLDLPVPQPVAAWYERKGPVYQASIIVERIPGAVTFGSVWRDLPEETWAEIGRVIRQFHDAGVFHADLNCFNILLVGETAYLIDFDRGYLLRWNDMKDNLKEVSLQRLYRSLKKNLCNSEEFALLEKQWAALVSAYQTVP
ncbi:3-deoxy-D-manno-octulosonic acid kinase [Marinobacter persicus]|uniref:3-deoxy-D-manno-octulosonic acid kinase n=1 Tax=Marinobacter persicus TaxID=930118 RepID=A0A1I3X9G2_9GAMM|nr:3-deoxy-D-manno-octulosonic acid kinase [Marinobacter persicus]GHD48905.1 3-deoxy-D-manno-octulosonic acid kinase [Marinobacter persicus]SFK16292.1 3-deoxy-D-manno-octulosonic acid kinase [Marinobacter persicus]